MSHRKDDLLLEKLAEDILPARGSGMPIRYLCWALLVTCLIAVLAGIITRPGLAVRFGQSDFLLQFGLWLGVVIVSSGSAFILATPRWPMVRGIGWAMGGLLAALTGYGAWLLMRMPTEIAPQAEKPEIACMVIVSGIGLLTAIGIALVLKGRAKPTYPLLMALMTAIAGAGAGLLAIMLVCPHEEAAHVLVSHFLPALGMGTLMALTCQRWWRW